MQKEFEALQVRWRKANDARLWLKDDLVRRYGYDWIAPEGQRKRLEALRDREQEACEAVFHWLDKYSPRDWRTGKRYQWVCGQLTYADAVTVGQLSAVPPPAWGASLADMERFAAPVGVTACQEVSA